MHTSIHPTIQALIAQANADGIERIVVAPVIRGDNSILIVRRKPNDFLGGYWEIPGGGVDDGEDILDALARETHEEIGCTIFTVRSYSSYFDYTDEAGRKTRQFNFDVELVAPLHITLSEHDQFHWLTREELALYPMSPEIQRTVQIAFAHTTASVRM